MLWIDDEMRPDDAAVHWLELDGYRVDCALSGAAGIGDVSARPPDIIVLDLRLPDMEGLTVLERLHENGVTTPVIVLTGYGDVESAGAAMRLGAAD